MRVLAGFAATPVEVGARDVRWSRSPRGLAAFLWDCVFLPTAAVAGQGAALLPPGAAAAGGTAAAGPALLQGRCWDGPAGCSAVMAAGPAAPRVLNVNVGVLGHIDSGKTALARALSTTGSTAAFDRAPQSRARGITLDLGFSCLRTALPPQLGPGPGELQFTLVDCPGHASLIRTIIGGAQIIDLMMLVIDVTKGMQTQSAECLVIGQIACKKMVVVLNKIDLLPEGKRQSAIEKMTKKMQKTLENTKFCGCPIVAVAAKPGGPEAPESENPLGVSELIEVTKKVKSMQMFHTPVTYAMQGDRVGICVTQFDPKLLERGLICTPESLHTIHAAIISLKKIQYFRGALQTKAKFHITVGHETVMGRVMFFSPAPADFNEEIKENVFDFEKDYLYQEEYLSKDSVSSENKENDQAEVLLPRQQWALLEFEKPVTCPKLCLVIGSKLDTDIHANTCRLAFHGVLLQGMEDKNYMETFLPKLKVYKLKHKEGQVERVIDDYGVIGRSLFKKETNIQIFVGLKVKLSTGEDGIIDGGFGQSGKFKIRIPDGLKPDTKMLLTVASKKKSKAGKGDTTKEDESSKNDSAQPVTISLVFKRYVFDTQKKMIQS
ncbi:selenocysteine-specific elongation factor isoform X2 [Phalacrocorax aristotelis]|uniref:selenocysteine-specific elongation factor isoform X2 n=1 Tax=Phalacrocorax aristotelis TaxID=126867 RepID=UPI003F4B7170